MFHLRHQVTADRKGGPAGLLFALILPFAAPAAATDLKCGDIPPGAESVSVIRTQPLRRGKTWRPGKPQSVFRTVCDPRGMKIEEEEYSRGSLVRKNRFAAKSIEEAGRICLARKTKASVSTTFGEENRGPLDDFCRKNRKKDFDAVYIFDAAQGAASEKPIRRIFRLYDKAGRTVEENEFGELADLETRTVYAYGPDDALTSRTEYAPDGSRLRRETYSSDKAAHARTTAFLDGNDLLQKTVTTSRRPDGTLRLKTVTEYEAGERKLGRTETHYDGKGVAEKELVFSGDLEKPSTEYRYSHKFDSRGNWTEERRTKAVIYYGKRIEDPKAAPQITLRKIGYRGAAAEKTPGPSRRTRAKK